MLRTLLVTIAVAVAVAHGRPLAEGNIIQVIEQSGLNTLVALVGKAGLVDTLKQIPACTVFGPTDEAFERLPPALLLELTSNVTLLAEVLKFHVLGSNVYSSDLSNDLLAESLFAPFKVRANIYDRGSVITAQGERVINPNVNATNGVLHVINGVMLPAFYNIPVFVTKDRHFSTLLTAVKTAGLVETLEGGPFTLFAPTDEAFAKLPADVLKRLLEDKDALTKVLTYHVVPTTVYAAAIVYDPTRVAELKTVEGQNVILRYDESGVQVDNARVVEADLSVTNGVIHAIDTVLIPRGLLETLY